MSPDNRVLLSGLGQPCVDVKCELSPNKITKFRRSELMTIQEYLMLFLLNKSTWDPAGKTVPDAPAGASDLAESAKCHATLIDL